MRRGLDRKRGAIGGRQRNFSFTRDQPETGQRIEHQERQILANGEGDQKPFRMPVARQKNDAPFLRRDGIRGRHTDALDGDLSRDRRQAGEAADKVALAIALDSSKAEHFAGPHFDADALQPVAADILGDKHGLIRLPPRHLGRIGVLNRLADDQSENILFRDARS